MGMETNQRRIFEAAAQNSGSISSITLGTVVDTNDPQQMGRIRAVCPQWGDTWGSKVEDLPWAIYMAPFGGQVQVGARGPGIQSSKGAVGYGMWAIPKVGSQVAVMCVDGDPMSRIFIGCVYDQFTPHTMPHGRFMYDDHPELEKKGNMPAPYGPYTSTENLIQPLATNLQQSFGTVGEPNHEFRTRGADYSATRVDVEQLSQTYSKVQDDKGVKYEDWTSTQGYQISRTDPNGQTSYATGNYDSMVYSFTSPGFHALSMDDRQENCRLKLRTTSGHQILLDDTNERIYIATAKGNNWVEMDQDGNIDVFSTNKVSIRSSKEINLTSDETVRLFGKKGVHIKSDADVRIEGTSDIHLKAGDSIKAKAGNNIKLQSGSDIHIKSSGTGFIDCSGSLNLKSGGSLNLGSGGTVNIASGGQILGTASAIHWNGPAAAAPGTAASADEKPSYWTNKIPAHEPYARVMTKSDFTHEPEFEYTDKNVGRKERGRNIDRSMFWRR